MADDAAVPSWQDIHQAAVRQVPQADVLSNIAFRNLLNRSAAPIGSSVPAVKQLPGSGTVSGDGNGHGFLADTANNIAKASQTPVIKQILDALSVGTYSTANAADDALTGVDKVAKGDLSGFLDIAASPVSGLGKGVMAAGGDKDSVKTWSDVIKHGQSDLGLDTENDAAKWTQGIGGFVGDVFLDPTTYLTLGAGPVAKGLVTGFKEGGKVAANIATKAVKDAGEVGEAVAPAVQRIADNADKAGLLNKFREAGVQASGNYKDWMAQNGGHIAKFDFPFAKSSNPKDAEAINPERLNASEDSQLADLVPKEAPTVAPDGRQLVPSGFKPEAQAPLPKSPEIAAEEKAISDGITEAAKPAGAPIVDDAVKAEKPKSKDEVLADIDHENMLHILDNVKFSAPTYKPNDMKVYADAHAASLPKTVEETAVKEAAPKSVVDTGRPDHNATMAALKEYPGKFIKFGLKSPNKDEIVKRYVAASKAPNPGQAMQQFWSQLPKDLQRTVQKTSEAPIAAKGKYDWDGLFSELEADPRKMLTIAGTKTSKGRIAQMMKEYLSAHPSGRSVSPDSVQFFKSLPKELTEKYLPKTGSTSVEKIAKEVPGVPIDYSHPALSKIKEEHKGMSPEELSNMRSSTGSVRHMQQYINNMATPQEIALLREKLGLKADALTGEISKEFETKWKAHGERLKAAREEAKLAPKATKEPKGRDIVGAGNQATAQLLEKVPVDQTLIRRATRAITTHADMKLDYHGNGGKVNQFLNFDDIQKIPDRAFEEALKVQSGVKNKLNRKMDGGALSDTPNPKTGIAIYPDKWGTLSATAIHGSIIKDIRAVEKQYAEKAGTRFMPVETKREMYQRAMRSTYANLRAMGIAPYLDLGRGSAKTGVNLGMDDISDLFHGDIASHFFAGRDKQIQPQAFATGVEALIRAKQAGKSVDEVTGDIMKALTGDSAMYRGKYKDAEGIMRGIDMESTIRDIKGDRQGIESAIKAGMEKGLTYAESKAKYMGDLKTMAERWAKDDNLYVNLNNRMLVNAREHAAELGQMVDHVSDATLAKIMEAGQKGISTGDFLNEMKQAIKDGKAALGEADDTKYILWENEAERIRNTIFKGTEAKTNKVAETVAKTAEETPTSKVKEDTAVANTKSVDAATTEAKQVIEEAKAANPEIPESFYDVHGGAISIDAMRRIHPISSFFNTKFGLDASGMANAMGTGLHTQVRMQSIFHGGVMNYLAKNPEKLMEDWKVIQNEGLLHVKGLGKSAESFVPSTQSAKDLYNVVNSIFDVSKDNIITRNGLGARHWNAVAQAKGLKLEMDESKSMLENSRAWLSHEGLKEPKDVLEFLSKSHAVATNLANDISIASNFARTFGSAVPKEGYALLKWSKQGVTKNKATAAAEKAYGFYDLLPKTVYYDKAASRDIANIHRVLNESRSIKPEGIIGNFMNNVFNPITNIMKASQTIVRPGHWVNNTLGDVMRNYLAGVNSITPYRHSIAMMKANGKEMKAFGENPLEAYQWHKATTKGDFEVHGRGDGVVVNIGGKPQKVSYESMYRLMQDGPIMPKHHGGGVAEDFMQANPEGMNKFGKALDNVQSKVLDNEHFSLNDLAATRDNFSRTALAIDHAMKGKFKDIHELKASMEEHVLKWVPTSTDFTAREAKYVRPAFMYYTWLRGVTPRIVDTLMNKPGVALGPSKLLYEAAKANGIDPMSIGDPFPPNAQMPSYYFDNVIGPLMKGEGKSLWGVNFANPVTDVMDQLGAGVTPGGLMNGSSELSMGKTLLGAASPFAKIPIDLATQTSNGVPIKDTTQYLQDAFTGSYGGLISKMAGKNIDGQGRTDTANGALHGEDQANIAKLQIANFLSGLKITDYNSPAAQRSYVGEQKANYSTAKADYRRNA